jgi:hypothetical protein
VKKKSNFGGIPILVSKVYYRVITIKAAWYWQERDMNRIEDPDNGIDEE